MERPSYLSNYLFNWDVFDIMLNAKSVLDSKVFVGTDLTRETAHLFMQGYGIDPVDPVSRAELFGTFQEALQFIMRYFLKDGNSEGLEYRIPSTLYMITDITDLFILASVKTGKPDNEERIWAEIVLKVMHTLLHIDKDLRSNYFSVIQTQIFDRFYKYLHRDKENRLFLGDNENKYSIPLVDFQTKAKKSRESVLIKLLHKVENVAEELFDRVGVRFITENRFDSLRVLKFLVEKSIVIPHNAKTSRSVNTLIDLAKFKRGYSRILKESMRHGLTETGFLEAMEREIVNSALIREGQDRNQHSKATYRSIQFTCRQLVKYVNPFFHEFSYLRQNAKEAEGQDNILAKKILAMDMSLISRDVRFFYPFEVQVVDRESHKANTEGEASHREYKKAQLKFARNRVFQPLIDYYARQALKK